MLDTKKGAFGFKFYRESSLSKLGFFEFVVGQEIEQKIDLGKQYSLQETEMNESIYFIKKDIKNPIKFQKTTRDTVLLNFLTDFFPNYLEDTIRQLKRDFQIKNDCTQEEKKFINLAVIERLESGIFLDKT